MCACECVHVSAANGSSGCQNCHFEWDITKIGVYGGFPFPSLTHFGQPSKQTRANKWLQVDCIESE